MPSGENEWRVGGAGVRLEHVTTGKILTVTRCSSPLLSCFLVSFFSKSYPESWGKDMQEVVASDSRNNEGTQWVVNFFQMPNMGEFDQFSYT